MPKRRRRTKSICLTKTGFFWILIFVVLEISGCGYKTGYTLKKGIRKLYVPMFENHTLRREIASSLTKSVIQKLQYKGGIQIYFSPSDCEATLLGEIVYFDKTVLSEGSGDQPLESSVSIRIKIRLVEHSSGEVIFSTTIEDTKSFLVGLGETEKEAKELAFENIAEKIVYHLEVWE